MLGVKGGWGITLEKPQVNQNENLSQELQRSFLFFNVPLKETLLEGDNLKLKIQSNFLCADF